MALTRAREAPRAGTPPGRPPHAATPPRAPLPVRVRRGLIPWLFLAPALVIFAYFKFLPMARGIYYSFFEVNPYAGNVWVGLDNFRRAIEDTLLRTAIWHTLIDVVVSVSGTACIGFLLALALQGAARSIRFVRTAVFLPVTTAVAVVAEVWRIMLFPADGGLVNTILGWIGVGTMGFLSDPNQSLASVIGVQIWKGAPYDMMIFIAGLASIDRDLYEAAAVDGANRWQRLRHVTIPGLRHVFVIIVTLGIIRGFRVFTDIWVLTGGGPGYSSEVVMTYVYKTGIQNADIGYASAVSSLLFVFTAVTTGLYLWRQQRKEAA